MIDYLIMSKNYGLTAFYISALIILILICIGGFIEK